MAFLCKARNPDVIIGGGGELTIKEKNSYNFFQDNQRKTDIKIYMTS